jgi:hypothetical protein
MNVSVCKRGTRRLRPWIIRFCLVGFLVVGVEGWNLQRLVARNAPRPTTENCQHRRGSMGRRSQEDGINPTLLYEKLLSSSVRTLLLAGMAATVFHLVPITAAAHAADLTNDNNQNYHQWDLLNGSVVLTEPIHLKFRDRTTGTDRSVALTKPQIVGAGGGGAVFSFLDDPQASSSSTSSSGSFQERDMLLKISWEGTAKTVQRECKTLQLLEDRNVQSAERCLGTFDYDYGGDTTSTKEKEAAPTAAPLPPRTMILVAPYMRDAVASVAEIDNEAARIVAVHQIARTLVQMLAANVITIDVQPLISRTTGQTIFIDMTEAQVLSSPSVGGGGADYSFLDQTLISSFTSEMVALIPKDYWKIAKTAILDEMEQMKNRGTELSKPAWLVLQDQTPFLVDD